MKTRDALTWFKTNFGPKLEPAVAGTPFSVDMFTAIAHQSLVDMAQYSTGYQGVARNPNKFCHGFGIFQYDIQFFKDDPAFFLQKKWCDFGVCIAKLIAELRAAMASRSLSWSNKTALSDTEKVYVAIAYNCGHADPRSGFKQGFHSDGRYDGENIFESASRNKSSLLRRSRSSQSRKRLQRRFHPRRLSRSRRMFIKSIRGNRECLCLENRGSINAIQPPM